VPDVASLLGGAAGVEAASAAAVVPGPAAAAAIDAVPTERAKDVLQQVLAARKQVCRCLHVQAPCEHARMQQACDRWCVSHACMRTRT
jgi:hypothetical protein